MPKFSAYMKGGDGSVGPPGASFISGVVSTTNLLPDNPPENRRIYLVGESDPKEIYVYILDDNGSGEWIRQGYTASKLNRVTASITTLAWTSEPRIETQFTTEDQLDNINFDFSVPMNQPPDFDIPSITTKRLSYTTAPTANITTEGPYYNKKFNFEFGIPEGVPGGFSTYQSTEAFSLDWYVNPTVSITPIEFTPNDSKSFLFNFGIPEGRAAGFSTNQHVTVSTLDTGEIATVNITTVTTSPEYAKEFNFHFGLPRGDALAIYDGVTFTSTEDGFDYHWEERLIDGVTTYPLIFNRGSVKKLPIYIYNENNENIASTFKISNNTIEYEADEKFDGTLYLMMPATLQSIEIGNVSSADYGERPSVSLSTGSTSSKIILDFIIPESGYYERDVIHSLSTDFNSITTEFNSITTQFNSITTNIEDLSINKLDDAPFNNIIYGRKNGQWSRNFIPYGICNSLANSTIKVVNISDFPNDSLTTGDTIFVRFVNSNEAKNPTLKVNNNDEKIIYRYGTTSPDIDNYVNGWQENSILALTYDATLNNNEGAWIEHLWQNNTYNLADNKNSKSYLIPNTDIYRYQLLFHKNTEEITALNESNTTNIGKEILKIQFDPFQKIYMYDSEISVSSSENYILDMNNCYISKEVLNLQYSFNIDNNNSLISNKETYLICDKINENLFEISSTTNPLTQTLPNIADNHYYLKLGRALNNFEIGLEYEKPIYYNDGSGIKEYFKSLINPILEGIPKAPTATTGTNTEQIATTKFVQNEINNNKPEDSGWISITSNYYTGTIYGRKIGNMVQLNGMTLHLVSRLTGEAIDLKSNLPENFHPSYSVNGGNTRYGSGCYIAVNPFNNSHPGLRFHRMLQDSAFETTNTFGISVTYFTD